MRDNVIDSWKGLCVISIILIHTVFHSGASYTPAYLKNLVLLFDVPVFFFLTGCLASIKVDLDPFKQMYKLICLFFFLTLFLELITGYTSLEHILEPLMLKDAYVKSLISVASSYWFVPTYIICLLYLTMITKYANKMIPKILLFIIPIYYLYSWFSGKLINVSTLGISSQIILFYFWLMLLGQQSYNNKKYSSKILWAMCGVTSTILLIFLWHSMPNFSLQNFKFPVKLPYCIGSMISISTIMLIKKEINSKILLFIGNKAIYFYLSQCIGSSLLFYIVPHLNYFWTINLIICFIINIIITLTLGYIFYQTDKNLSAHYKHQ